jgi:hypothetical protein
MQQKITHLGDARAEQYKYTAVITSERGGERYGDRLQMLLLQRPHGHRDEQMHSLWPGGLLCKERPPRGRPKGL